MAREKLTINSKNCPKGKFTFAAVTGKGILNDNNEDDLYEYKVTLELDEDIAGPLMDEIDDFIEDHAPSKKELTKVPYQTHDDYEGVPKGKVWLAAKAITTWEDKDGELQDTKINIYDALGNKVQLPEGVGIGNGSTGKITGNMTIWERKKEYGATLWLSGVQIADFVPYEFEEQVEVMEGSFKGFNTPQLQKDEDEDEPADKSSRRSSRRSNRNNDSSDEDEPADKSSRRSSRRSSRKN